MNGFDVKFEKVRIVTRLNNICSLGELNLILHEVEKGKFKGKNGENRQFEKIKIEEYQTV